MQLIRINNVVKELGISSRTLRYYEEVGLLTSCHPNGSRQRYYDDKSINKIKQIQILRILQIPIKDIIRILREDDLVALINTLMQRLNSISNEIENLYELKTLIREFINRMRSKGITKISGITLLYEIMDKSIINDFSVSKTNYNNLDQITKNTNPLQNIRIIRLPTFRVLTAEFKEKSKQKYDDINTIHAKFANLGIYSTPGLRESFYQKKSDGSWMYFARIRDSYINKTPYIDGKFNEGLFAVATSYIEDMDSTIDKLIEWIQDSDLYDIAFGEQGNWTHDLMVEELLPHDISLKLNRYQQDIFIPIKMLF